MPMRLRRVVVLAVLAVLALAVVQPSLAAPSRRPTRAPGASSRTSSRSSRITCRSRTRAAARRSGSRTGSRMSAAARGTSIRSTSSRRGWHDHGDPGHLEYAGWRRRPRRPDRLQRPDDAIRVPSGPQPLAHRQRRPIRRPHRRRRRSRQADGCGGRQRPRHRAVVQDDVLPHRLGEDRRAEETPDLFYFACDRNAPFQGVSVGWIDQYHHALEGQEIDLTGAPSGVYYLRVRVNDEGKFVESTTADNIAWRSFPPVAGQPGQPEDRVHLGLTVHQPEHVRQRAPNRWRGPGPNTAGRRPRRRRGWPGRSAVPERVIQYSVSGVGGVLKRALTTHSRPFCQAAVVGMSSAGSVSVSTFFRPRIVNR